jgi:hypothetical protein
LPNFDPSAAHQPSPALMTIKVGTRRFIAFPIGCSPIELARSNDSAALDDRHLLDIRFRV